MRRITFALLVVTMLVVGVAPAAVSAPSAQGTLNSAFNTWFTGGEAVGVATFERGGSAWFHSATSAFAFDTFDIPGEPNSGTGAIRLSPVPGWPSGPFCDSNTFGIWVVIFGSQDDLEALSDQVLSLNGEPLDAKQTPIKPIFDPEGYWEGEVGSDPLWFSFGVPVYGALDPGLYDIEWESGGSVVSNTVEIVACP
jgi:hypothetical protein